MNDDDRSVLLSACAGALKDAYQAKMRMLEPEFQLFSGPEAELKWEALAKRLIDARLDPFGYVQYCFDFCGEHLDGFYVPVVISARMVERYKARLPEHEAELAESVKYQFEHVTGRLDRGESVTAILTDPHAPVNVAVRFAMASALQDAELAARFKPDAVYLLTFEPHLKKLLGKWLPEELKT